MKRITIFLFLSLVSIALIGCAKTVQKEWFAHDGSKADGTVKLALTWNPNLEKPQAQQEQAQHVATKKCQAWGYAGAEAFGSIVSRCIQSRYTGFGTTCDEMLAEMTFQCVGEMNTPTKITDVKK